MMLRIYFNTISILTSYNLELPNVLTRQGAKVYVEISHPLLFGMYVLEKTSFAALPPYISSILRRYLLKKVDIVHLNAFDLGLARAAKSLNKPVVFVLHTAPFNEEFYRLVNEYVDVYVAPSRFTYEGEYRKIGSKKVVTIPHGINTELFNPKIPKSYARKKLGLPESGKVVLWNDRISPEKDLELFLDACEEILHEVKDAIIYIKGRAVVKSYLQKIKKKLEKLRKSGRVIVHIGWIPHHKLPLLYRAADIFVRTSIYENFGLGVVEAMASGIPVVAPKRATFPEILNNFPDCLSESTPEDLADKVIAMLNNDQLRHELGNKLREIAEKHYSWNVIALRYTQLYKDLSGKD